jgi:F-box domain
MPYFQILYEIFQHLSVSDRQSAGMVCKKWFDVSKHNAFLRNCVVKIQNRQFCEERIAKNGNTDTDTR